MFLRSIPRAFVKMVGRCVTTVTLLALGALAVSLGCDGSATDNAGESPDPPTLGATINSDNSPDTDQLGAPGETADDLVRVTFDAGPGFCCNPLSIEFNAELSDSMLASGAVFEWDLGDGRQATGATAHHTYPWAGEYQVVLEVRLPDGVTLTVEQILHLGINAQGSVEIDLSPTPTATVPGDEPDDTDGSGIEVVADAGDDDEVAAGEVVVLDGSGSTGNGAESLTFSWRQVFGPPVTLDNLSSSLTTFTVPSDSEQFTTLVFELTVVQGDASDRDQVAISVPPTEPPVVVAHAGPDQSVESGAVVVLDGSDSSGTGAGDLVFSWTQIAGPAVELEDPLAPTTTFAAPSTEENHVDLVFELTVVQGTAEGHDLVSIEVTPADDGPEDPSPSDEPDEDQILEWMRALEPLPKVHYSWDFPKTRLSTPIEPLLFEFVRLTHGISIRGESAQPHHVMAAVTVCHNVNSLAPDIPAAIAINYSPWHRVFPADAPPTDFGPMHDAEINLFQERMTLIREWVDAANVELGADVRVASLLLDSERFLIKDPDEEGYQEWNDAIDEKYNAIYLVGREIFPTATVDWWSRGMSRRFTLEELGDTFSTWLYELPFENYTEERFREGCEAAEASGMQSISTWVALAAGFDSTDSQSRVWQWNWDYDVGISWQLGAKMNGAWDQAPPGDAVPWEIACPILFYPRPFDDRTPSWGKHFVAYVRGAHGIFDLP